MNSNINTPPGVLLDICNDLEAARFIIDALLGGRWDFTVNQLEALDSITHRAMLRMRADRFARGVA